MMEDMSRIPELQQVPCLSTTPVLQHNDAFCVPLQGPREIAHLGPANPGAHAQVPLGVLQLPAPMQSLSLEQPWLPHSCSALGADSPFLMHACTGIWCMHTINAPDALDVCEE